MRFLEGMKEDNGHHHSCLSLNVWVDWDKKMETLMDSKAARIMDG